MICSTAGGEPLRTTQRPGEDPETTNQG